MSVFLPPVPSGQPRTLRSIAVGKLQDRAKLGDGAPPAVQGVYSDPGHSVSLGLNHVDSVGHLDPQPYKWSSKK